MIFRKKTKINSDEYEEIVKKIVAVVGGIDVLKTKVEVLETNFRSLRAKVNRNISQEPESESSINDDGFNFLRKNGAF